MSGVSCPISLVGWCMRMYNMTLLVTWTHTHVFTTISESYLGVR